MAEIKFHWPTLEDERMAKESNRSRNTLSGQNFESNLPLLGMASLLMNR